jgi:hypothetical protein
MQKTISSRQRGFLLCALSMGAHLRVQVPLRAGHIEQSEAQLREGGRYRKKTLIQS